MSSKLKTGWVVLFVSLISLSSVPGFAHGRHPDGGGGTIPTPFSTANLKVELADGENYLLQGTIVVGPRVSDDLQVDAQQAWFIPDFNAQPWLANEKRVLNPAYPIDHANWSDWSSYGGAVVHLTVQAKGSASWSTGTFQYVIMLEPAGGSAVEVVCK